MSNWGENRFNEVKALTRQILKERYGKPTKRFKNYEVDNGDETEDCPYDDDPEDCFFD